MINTTQELIINSTCINLGEFQTEAFSEITKWIFLIEGIGIIILNSMLILLVAKRKKPNRMAFFVSHLAVADLCVGLIYVLPECIFDRFINNWEKFSCIFFYGYCANLTLNASTFLIVVLSVDRLYVIKRPLSSSTTGKRYRYGLISGAWLLAVFLAIPYVLNVKFVCTTYGNLCGHGFQNQEAIIIAELFISLIIPVSIIAFCYTWIILIIWRRDRIMASIGYYAHNTHERRFSNGASQLTGNLPNMKLSRSPVVTIAKKKTIKILFVVVIVYIVSWTPINIAQVLNVTNVIDAGDVFPFLYVFSPLNSLMNPLVFLLFNRQLLKAEKEHCTRTKTCPR